MAVVIALYVAALSLSLGFFLWAVYSFVISKRVNRKRQIILDLGPDTEPAIVALYCQYLVAPQKAMREAQQTLASMSIGRRNGTGAAGPADFFEVLDLLQSRSPASSR